MIIKTESVYKSYLKCQVRRLGWRDLVVKLKAGGGVNALSGSSRVVLIKVENVSWERIFIIDLNCYMI